MSDEIRILFLATNPTDLDHLRLDEEAREIERQIEVSSHRTVYKFKIKLAVRFTDLQKALLEYKPHIVHLSGHGTEEEGIVLEDQSGNAQPVGAKTLAALFTVLKDNVRIVVLNACYSKAQARAISKVIDFTVGMNDAIGDEAAVAFSASFYLTLGFGRSVKAAFDTAKASLMIPTIDEAGIPKLIVRKGVDENTSLITLQEPSDQKADKPAHARTDRPSNSLSVGGSINDSPVIVGNNNVQDARRFAK